MARPASIASGGFFALPPPVVPLIAGLLNPVQIGYAWAFADLCMGTGDAVCGIVQHLFPAEQLERPRIYLYGVEMEHGRYLAARRWRTLFHKDTFAVEHGDAFRLSTAPAPSRYTPRARDGASAILLNPPYENGVMEARFLAHSLPFFGKDGVLIYVVPVSALTLSAPILAQWFCDLRVYRFPAPHYAAFKQVVLVGSKRTGALVPDPKVEARLRELATHPEKIPVLSSAFQKVIDVPSYQLAGFHRWVVQPTDTAKLLAKIRPWHMTTKAGVARPIPGIMPEDPGEDLMKKTYPLASVPRPAYVSAALAADIYSGKLILPHVPASGLPPLLIKGVFDKANVEVDERVNKDGEVTGKVTIEQPRLAVTVLDLERHAYHTLKNSVEVTGATLLADMTMGDLLEHYGPALLEAMFDACPILHDSRNPEHAFPLPELGRPLYKAQAHAVMTCVKLLGGPGLPVRDRRGWSGFLYGQLGVGKSQTALGTMRAIGSRRPVIMCPPNILQSWRDQIHAVCPGARIRMLDSLDAVDEAAAASTLPGEEIAILSREGAKLGHAWQGIGSTAIVPLAVWGEGTETGTAWLNDPLRPTVTVLLTTTKFGLAAPEKPGDKPLPAEMYLALETSDDGIAWRYLASFSPVRAVGEVKHTFRGCGRWLRAAWTTTGEVTFGLDPETPLRKPGCPGCGTPINASPDELARNRATCAVNERRPLLVRLNEDAPLRRCPAARMAEELALALLPVVPGDHRVVQHLHGRMARRAADRLDTKIAERRAALHRQYKASDATVDGLLDGEALARWRARPTTAIRQLFPTLLALRIEREKLPHQKGEYEARKSFDHALHGVVAAVDDPAWAAEVVMDCYAATKEMEDHPGTAIRELCRSLLLLLPPGSPVQRKAEHQCCALALEADNGTWRGSWASFRSRVNALLQRRYETARDGSHGVDSDGAIWWGVKRVGHHAHALAALEALTELASWDPGEACGERLYQAVPIPRRYPVAKYITKRHPKLFDFFLLDEAHQYASPSSAQSFAARRLIWTGMPCLLLTGTSMGGYAEQLFTMQWAVDPEFRAEFDMDEVRRFVEIYGFLKRMEEDRDPTTKAVVRYGSMSDRVERSSRVIGSAPGVLPLFLMRFMLRKACILHRSDFDFELPGLREIPVPVVVMGEHLKRYEALKEALKKRIKADKRDPERRGKLMGQLTRLPAYLDMATADCGNGEGGAFEMSYPPPPVLKTRRVRGAPKRVQPRGELVCRAEPFPADHRLAKEEAMIKTARAELAEGRPFVVFAWNAPVLARLHRVLSADLGEPVAFLQASKVAAADRQDWIDREVIAKKIRVLVVNPVCVGVGLNNLVYFPTAFWFENPMCDAVIRRQADGRFDRLGKTLETRIYTFFYDETVQEQLFRLWTHKVGVSMATDGLDASGALAAAGVGEQDRFSDLAIANVIYAMIDGSYKAPKTSKAAVTLGAVFAAE